MAKYHDIFALEDGEMGCTEAAEHKIKVTDPKPFKERPSNIPSGLLEEVKDNLDHMLDVGAIKPSKSAWSIELNYLTCLVYLDDVIIYSSMQEEHIKCLWAVLEHFRIQGLKLKPSKCKFFKEKIEYLGHSISLKGVWPSKDNLKAIAKYPKPMMYTAIKGFIDLIGHFRHFITDFAKIADPLHEYARGDTAKKKKKWVVLNKAARSAFHKLWWVSQSLPILIPIKNICSKWMPQSWD